MVSIAKACDLVGIARSTLLYYERIGIISPARNPENGYREYSQQDLHALVLIRQLKKAGFKLSEAHKIMQGSLDPQLILSRYQSLQADIREKMMAKEIVKSLLALTKGSVPEDNSDWNPAGRWHAELEKIAGEAHAEWLTKLGFDEKDQIYIRWVSRNIDKSQDYMKDFFLVFEQMQRQGPGSPASTLHAFNAVPQNEKIESILEIGCGKGQSCLILADNCNAKITAIDNHQPFLDHLAAQAEQKGLADRIDLRNMSMMDMDFRGRQFDLVWSEGSAYFMGFKKALAKWKPLIKPDGHLFISDAVWLTDSAHPECTDYFAIEYPSMTDAATRKHEARKLGYDIVSEFTLPHQDWLIFYNDMEACIEQAVSTTGMTRAYENLTREIRIGRTHGKDYGYLCLILKPVP